MVGARIMVFLRILILLSLSLILIANVNSQRAYYDFGARSGGMGQSNTVLADEWSILNNVGGISGVESGKVFFGYTRFTQIEGFDQVAFGAIQPFKFGNIGIAILRFGDQLFNEQVISAAFGNKIGFVRLGGRISYYQMHIEEYGNSGAALIDLGGIVELIPKLDFGAYISNITMSSLNNAEKSPLPVVMKLGMSYKPSEDLIINVDLHKETNFGTNVRVGVEYEIVRQFALRTGINTNPFKAFFGAGLYLGRFSIDYALTTHEFLGISHQASISYRYQGSE